MCRTLVFVLCLGGMANASTSAADTPAADTPAADTPAADTPAAKDTKARSSVTAIQTELFPGTLYLATTDKLSERQTRQFQQEIDRRRGTLLAVHFDAMPKASEAPSILATMVAGSFERVALHSGACSLSAAERSTLVDELEKISAGDCVWFGGDVVSACDDQSRQWLSEQWMLCLQRGALVCLQFSSSTDQPSTDQPSTDQPSTDQPSTGQPSTGQPTVNQSPLTIGLGSSIDVRGKGPSLAVVAEASITLSLPTEAWLCVHGRELVNLSEMTTVEITLPKTDAYPDDWAERVRPRSIGDLVAVQRAAAERKEPAFPSLSAVDHRLGEGSLVIVGGGGMPREVWEKFVELAGGVDAHIVVLPTGVPDPVADASEVSIFKRLGINEVRVLPQIGRDEVSSASYLENLKWATGVWFGGGRQWRFVDAYWGTPAWEEIINVAGRGGVIGGSSAGATIQGDLLVRGHPLGNHIMVADGYRHGLGLLPGVAIDQHFRQRNRFDDLSSVIDRFPQVLGIGIDEATALVVEAPDQCLVMGEGSVWLTAPRATGANDSELPTDSGARHYREYPAGSNFTLGKHSD